MSTQVLVKVLLEYYLSTQCLPRASSHIFKSGRRREQDAFGRAARCSNCAASVALPTILATVAIARASDQYLVVGYEKIVNHCGIHSDICSGSATCKTHDARCRMRRNYCFKKTKLNTEDAHLRR